MVSQKWAELSIGGSETIRRNPGDINSALGILVFDGSEELFAIDGQHRVVVIKRAVESEPELGEDEVTVIFVGHRTNKQGANERATSFTTFNHYINFFNNI
jgi:hypothetical protein